MIKIFIFLTFLTFIQCQELVVRSWIRKDTDGEQTIKTYYKSEWNNTPDIAVYGWFKINSVFSRTSYSTLFHLTTNDASFVDISSAGDRVLTIFMINNNLHSGSYTTGNNNAYLNVAFQNSDVDKWNFFHVSYGLTAQKVFYYFNLFSSGVKTTYLNNIVHKPSNFYRIYLGQSVSYQQFPGSLFNIIIKGGNDAYKDSNFQSLMLFNPNDPIPVMPSDIDSKLKVSYNIQGADVVLTLQC